MEPRSSSSWSPAVRRAAWCVVVVAVAAAIAAPGVHADSVQCGAGTWTGIPVNDGKAWTVGQADGPRSEGIGGDEFTYKLYWKGLGCSVPAGATIDGVEFQPRLTMETSTAARLRVSVIGLILPPGFEGSDQCDQTGFSDNCGTTDIRGLSNSNPKFSDLTFGSATNKWGETLDQSAVTNTEFGIYLQIKRFESSGTARWAQVLTADTTLTIHYTPCTCTVPSSFPPQVVPGSNNPCTESQTLNCGNGCVVECATGYSGGTGFYLCNGGSLTDNSPTCTEAPCPLTLGTGIVGCSTPLASGQSCNVACDSGYDESAGSRVYSCNLGVVTQTATLTCSPQGCTLPADLGTGVQSASSNGCAANGNLASGDSCDVECASGYDSIGAGTTTSYSCNLGQRTDATLNCEQQCTLPATFSTGVVGLQASSPCTASQALPSQSTCNVECATGYDADTGTTAFSCNDGTLNASPTLICTPRSCSLPSNYSLGVESAPAPNGCAAKGGSLASGESCEVQCAGGFSGVGGTTAYSCQLGALTAPTLLCDGDACAMPSQFSAGVQGTAVAGCAEGQPLPDGGTCNVECAPGYSSAGGSTAFSCSAAQLTRAQLVCTPDGCTLPANFSAINPSYAVLAGGCVEGGQLAHAASCAIGCSGGLSITGGSASVTCRLGQLDNFTLTCGTAPPPSSSGSAAQSESASSGGGFELWWIFVAVGVCCCLFLVVAAALFLKSKGKDEKDDSENSSVPDVEMDPDDGGDGVADDNDVVIYGDISSLNANGGGDGDSETAESSDSVAVYADLAQFADG